ncbi:MAG: Gfo/Idh/MocA family oxidoreductase [Clostridiales bacterium]|jgi:predicted dehydrogenase|nr:Gfo/Idh/MocA family oxidoreductase [Clostridiales bacterium]
MSKHKIGIIGCGSIANAAHIPSYLANDSAEIAYFCDILPERARAAVEKYGCGKAVTDYKEVLADASVDAVSVCTPNDAHGLIAVDALNAGKHTLCEKPAARTLTEALEMQRVCGETGKILNIGVVNRFNDAVNRVKAIIDGGGLGEVYSVYVSFRSHRAIPGLGGAFTTKAVSGGGVLIDWGVHFLDIVMYCCGDPLPRTVSGAAFCKLGNPIGDYTYTDMWAGPPNPHGVCDVDDAVTGVVRTSGPVITFNGAWAQNIGENEMFIDFMGTKAGIRLNYGADFVQYGAADGMLTKTGYTLGAGGMFGGAFQNEIDAFLRCTETGEKLPSHIDTVLVTARLLDAIYRSAEKQEEVTL